MTSSMEVVRMMRMHYPIEWLVALCAKGLGSLGSLSYPIDISILNKMALFSCER